MVWSKLRGVGLFGTRALDPHADLARRTPRTRRISSFPSPAPCATQRVPLLGFIGFVLAGCGPTSGEVGVLIRGEVASDASLPDARPVSKVRSDSVAALPPGPSLPAVGDRPAMSPMPGATTGTSDPPAAGSGSGAKPPMTTGPAPNGARCGGRAVSSSKPCSDDPDPCGIRSGWDGDEYCLVPPAPGEGIQIHFGPDDYADPSKTNQYKLDPGLEFNNSVLAHVLLDSDRFYYRIQVQMRPGSHHWLSSVVAGRPAEGFYQNTSCNSSFDMGVGGQNLVYDNPPGGIPAPENEGIGWLMKGNSSLCVNLHAYNFQDKPILREIWINLYFIDQAAVTQRTNGIGLIGARYLNLAPGQMVTKSGRHDFQADGRIVQLLGHRHKWTPRFEMRLNGALVYDSHDWLESVTYNYDSLTVNPPIDGVHDGAVSGPLLFKAGDRLEFNCFIQNDSDHALTFKNEIENGEMCNLWGSFVGGDGTDIWATFE